MSEFAAFSGFRQTDAFANRLGIAKGHIGKLRERAPDLPPVFKAAWDQASWQFDALFRFIELIEASPSIPAPEPTVIEVTGSINSLIQKLEALQNPNYSDIGSFQNDLDIGNSPAGRSFFTALLPYAAMGMGALYRSEPKDLGLKIAEAVDNAVTDSLEEVATVLEFGPKLRTLVTDGNELLPKLREQAGSKAVSVHASKYATAAAAHNWVAFGGGAILSAVGLWLSNLAGSAITSELSAVKPAIDVSKPALDVNQFPSGNQLVLATLHHLPSVLLTIVILIVALRVFFAERHNAIVCQQKSTALSTFDTFIAAGTPGATRDAVLLATTSYIFGNQGTGYGRVPLEQVLVPLKLTNISNDDKDK